MDVQAGLLFQQVFFLSAKQIFGHQTSSPSHPRFGYRWLKNGQSHRCIITSNTFITFCIPIFPWNLCWQRVKVTQTAELPV